MNDSTGLGAEPQDFFGRRAELRQLDELAVTGTTPVIEVSGPDGVGKSALVAHWGRRAAHLFPNGQIWLDCSGPAPQSLGRAADLLTELLSAVGAPTGDLPVRTDARAQLWQAALQGKRMLIVLDGATGTDQVRPLLARTPGCVTVVISNGKLRSLVAEDGAGWVPVARMSIADATLALAAPAAAAGVPESEVVVLAEHSAGLPLIVRIVSALLATASRSAVTSLVGELRAGAGSANGVVAVLRAAHAALPPMANRMLPLLTLCPGTAVEFDAACAATGLAEADARSVLDGLVSAGLLASGTDGLVSVHEVIAPFARHLLDQGDPADARQAQDRLLQHYLTLADGVLAVLEPARVMRLPLPTGRDRVTAFEEAADAFGWLMAHTVTLVAVAQRSLVDGEVLAVSTLLERVFWSLWIRGDVGQLMPVIEEAERIAVEVDSSSSEMTLANMIGLDAARLGDLETATTWLSRAAGAASRADHQAGLTGSLLNLATMSRLSGRTREAIAAYEEAVAIKQAAGDGDILLGLSSLISTYLELGDVASAGRAAQTARDIVEGGADEPHPRLGRVMYHLSEVAFARGEFDAVLDNLTIAEPASRARADFDSVAQILMLRAMVLAERGEHETAQELMEQASEIALRDEQSDLAVSVLGARARVEIAAGRYADASRHLRTAIDRAGKLGLRFAEADSLYRLALARRAVGDLDEAATTVREAMEVADECEFGSLIEECNLLVTELGA